MAADRRFAAALSSLGAALDELAGAKRDRSNIERLLVLHLHDIDLVRVRALIEEIGLALNDPERVAAFDRMVAAVPPTRS